MDIPYDLQRKILGFVQSCTEKGGHILLYQPQVMKEEMDDADILTPTLFEMSFKNSKAFLYSTKCIAYLLTHNSQFNLAEYFDTLCNMVNIRNACIHRNLCTDKFIADAIRTGIKLIRMFGSDLTDISRLELIEHVVHGWGDKSRNDKNEGRDELLDIFAELIKKYADYKSPTSSSNLKINVKKNLWGNREVARRQNVRKEWAEDVGEYVRQVINNETTAIFKYKKGRVSLRTLFPDESTEKSEKGAEGGGKTSVKRERGEDAEAQNGPPSKMCVLDTSKIDTFQALAAPDTPPETPFSSSDTCTCSCKECQQIRSSQQSVYGSLLSKEMGIKGPKRRRASIA